LSAILPLLITIGIYIWLFIYYILLYLYPTIAMDYSKIPYDAKWTTDDEKENHRSTAIVLAYFFSFFAVMLFYSIMKTVFTSPGHIPEEREWDMISDNLDSEIETDKETSSRL